MDDTQAGGAAVRPPYVLIVDDDPAIGRLFRTALEHIGYEVDVAGRGDEALSFLEKRCPDALITDLIMPDTSGDQVARRCRELCPDTHLIFISGYDAQQLRIIGITQVTYVPKPVSLHYLQTLLQDLLGR